MNDYGAGTRSPRHAAPHPADRHFTVLRILGSGDFWVSESIVPYDGIPSYSVSIMEFEKGSVTHETQYFAVAFGAPEWRTSLAEPMPGRDITRVCPGPKKARSASSVSLRYADSLQMATVPPPHRMRARQLVTNYATARPVLTHDGIGSILSSLDQPDTGISYQKPPFKLMLLPVDWPGAESPM